MDKSVGEIAELIDGQVVGDDSVRITGINTIKEAQRGDLTFVAGRRYLRYINVTQASALLVTPDISKSRKPLIQVDDPYTAFAVVAQQVRPHTVRHPEGIHPTAVIGKDVALGGNVGVGAHACIEDGCAIGDGVILYAGVFVGSGCTIGDHTLIYPNVVIREEVQIGARCIIHPGAVIGSDGFGFDPGNAGHQKIPQIGTVIIEDDVEIGANSAVDRATFTETRIGRGTKIDNLVQVGHNVHIGQECILSGMAGIAGSARLGNRVIIAAKGGVNGHIEIGDGAIVGGDAGVTKSVKPGQVVSGFPARDHDEEKRVWASARRLPQALRRIKELEARVAQLEGLLNGQAKDDC